PLPLALALMLCACGKGEPLLPPDAKLPDGGRYRGEVVGGLLQGQGRIDYPNGSGYQGGFKDGQYDGNGQWHGSDGQVYRGQFRAGLFEGEGSLKEPGRSYRGGFKQGEFSGDGHLELDDGTQLQGQFAHGKLNGEGVRSDEVGNQFSGRFTNGELQGHGNFSNADGDQYTGGFNNGHIEGRGRYETQAGDVWVGEFKNGAPNGKGELIGADGSHYVGDFVDWHFNGNGRLALADGTQYQGQFQNDSYHGQGTLTHQDGHVESGYWANGQRIRDERGRLLPDPLEVGLLNQGRLLDAALAQVPPSTPALELYSLVVAGDGQQSVFLREADYVTRLLATRFGARGQVTLVNHRDHLGDRPMASRETLSRAVQVLAQRTGPEDLIFIYLTSHGSHDHELVLDQPRLQLSDLPADELASVLAPLKQRDKVVVISACYSGGFVPALKDAHTLVMAASRADRVSFGCSEEADFTYFGDALFAQALNQTDDLREAFTRASAIVAQREAAENFEASEPQLWAPKAVIEHWQRLRGQQASRALQSAWAKDVKLPATR
ncbi:C13 family peptidase, partial [Pseudomonas typographi]|uniref:C13 family peptidase n=1 Tax=Pseudomonas typographi TaxID=2715964 RepID=UPI00168211D4